MLVKKSIFKTTDGFHTKMLCLGLCKCYKAKNKSFKSAVPTARREIQITQTILNKVQMILDITLNIRKQIITLVQMIGRYDMDLDFLSQGHLSLLISFYNTIPNSMKLDNKNRGIRVTTRHKNLIVTIKKIFGMSLDMYKYIIVWICNRKTKYQIFKLC